MAENIVKKAMNTIVGGGVTQVAKGVETIGGVFTTNKENDAERASEEQLAILKAYQAEFNARNNRGWPDKVADAANRLVRPVIVCLVLFIFIIAYISPQRLQDISLAMSAIPDGYWALLSVIVAFYFGGRMQLKGQQFKISENQAKAVQNLIEKRKAFRKIANETDEPDKLVGDSIAKSGQIDQVRNDLVNTVVETALDDNSVETLQKQVDTLRNESVDDVIKRRRVGPKRFGRM